MAKVRAINSRLAAQSDWDLLAPADIICGTLKVGAGLNNILDLMVGAYPDGTPRDFADNAEATAFYHVTVNDSLFCAYSEIREGGAVYGAAR